MRQLTYRALGEFHCPCHGRSSAAKGPTTPARHLGPQVLPPRNLPRHRRAGRGCGTEVSRDFRLVV